MSRYRVAVLVHMNVDIEVEADGMDAAYDAAERLAREQTENRDVDPDDITLVEGISLTVLS